MSDLTIRMLVLAGTALVAFLVAAVSGVWFVPMLRRLKFEQTVRDAGPAWHRKKQGTPTIGGVIFVLGFVVALVVGLVVCEALIPGVKPISAQAGVQRVRLIAGVVMALACGAIGFADDFIKVKMHRNLGLTASQKILLQLIVGVGYAAIMYFMGGFNDPDAGTIHVPIAGDVHIGWWFLPICVFFVVGFPNATNLTDGIDGLCGSVSVVSSLLMMAAAMLCGVMGQGMVAAAFAGALAGFLVWNMHPAKVFMGDTGSLMIGGVLCAVAFGIGQPLLLIPVGIVYIVETVSVMLQVAYCQLNNGKRLFRMTPIHHHFEMGGWSENTIVAVFSFVTALCGGVFLLLVF